jgi:hypothetical protein
MLTEFLEDIEILTVPEVKVWDEELEQMVVTAVAQYRTQTILKTRPPTEAQSRLDMVISLGKPQAVIDKFILGVNLGIAWDWCEAYIKYMNDLDTWNKWEAVQEFGEEGEPLPLDVKPDAPTEPVRIADVINTYARTVFKAERAAKVENLKVTVDGMVFDADETSHTRMVAAIASMEKDETQLWVLADNSVKFPTKEQLIQAAKLARTAQTAVWTQ